MVTTVGMPSEEFENGRTSDPKKDEEEQLGESELSEEQMAILPEQLITDILSLLPVKSLLRFQCVSKPWFALIHDPYFINLYFENNNNNRELSFIVETSKHELSPLRRWKYDYHLVNFSNEDESMSEPLKIIPPFFRPHNLVIGCCNSLVCILNYDDMFSTYDGFDIVIWNPSIKKYKRLPFEHIEPAIEPNPQIEQSLAFGYDPVNNDYKVLMIVFVTNEGYGRKPLETMVYSMKAHSWRRAEDQWPCKDSNIWSGPAFSNPAFHWLIKSTTSMTLLAFNLTTEKFRVLPIPFKSYSIRVLEGSLCVSVNTKDQDVGSQHINV
ncbi:F-box/kelch-repeat protein At3g06240-like [Corylus avellana]|uniref:F-box/kelch-repeat protein At3g06240-like n=1 Tax=Corylus avellana TaxID=13451 RepID=UPI00286A75E2|nr:F-box/kelch-repeat protein At3g06240-like [Corylus avellana]